MDVRGIRGLALVLVLVPELLPGRTPTAAAGAGVFAFTLAFLAHRAMTRRSTRTVSRRGHAAPPGRGFARLGTAWAGALVIPAAAGVPAPTMVSATLGLAGAVAIVFGNRGRRDSVLGRALGSRPAQYAGRLAYPTFLWLALVIGLPTAAGHWPHLPLRAGLVSAALALGVLTKQQYESRFVNSGRLRPRHSYVIATSATLAVVGLILTPTASGTRHTSAAELVAAVTTATGCDVSVGALCAAPHAGAAAVAGSALPATQAPAEATSAASLPGGAACWSVQPQFAPTTCVFGDRNAKVSVALAGDSRAGDWLPALEFLAAAKHWRITAFLAAGCPLAQADGGVAPVPADAGCQSWVRYTTRAIGGGDYDLVLLANSATGSDLSGRNGLPAGNLTVLHELRQAGKAVIEIPSTDAVPKVG
jgi:hypothetical protein